MTGLPLGFNFIFLTSIPITFMSYSPPQTVDRGHSFFPISWQHNQSVFRLPNKLGTLSYDYFYLKIAGPCYIYEPHFSEDDKMIVEKLGCHLIEHNEVK